MLLRRSALSLLLASAAFLLPAQAQFVYRWNLPGDGPWDFSTPAWATESGISTTWNDGGGLLAAFGEGKTPSIITLQANIHAGGIAFRGLRNRHYQFVQPANTSLTLGPNGSGNGISLDDAEPGVSFGRQAVPDLQFIASLTVMNQGGPGAAILELGGLARGNSFGFLAFNGQGTTDLNGNVTSSNFLVFQKIGTGLLRLNSPASVFGGQVFLSLGDVQLENDGALGILGNQVYLGSASVRLAPGLTLPRTFNVSGTAAAPSALLVPGGASATLSESAALNGSSSGLLRIAALSGTSSAPGTLVFEASNTASFASTIEVGTRGLTAFSTQALPPPPSRLVLRGNGRLPALARLRLQANAHLIVEQPESAVTGRFGLSTQLESNGSTFCYEPSPNGGAQIQESAGTLTLRGVTTVLGPTRTGPTLGTSITFLALFRRDHATVALRAPEVGPGRIGGSGSPESVSLRVQGASELAGQGTPSVGLIPWAFGTGDAAETRARNLVTYDQAGLRPLDLASETVATTTKFTAEANNDLQAALSHSGASTINALLNTTGQAQLTGDGTITVSSGAITNREPLLVAGPQLVFPSGGYLHPGAPVRFEGASSLGGSNGLTISALGQRGATPVTFAQASPSTFTGGLFLQGAAQLIFDNNLQLGQANSLNAGAITLGGGQLLYRPAAAATATLGDGTPRAIVVNDAGGSLATGTAEALLEVPGQVRGSGQLQFGGPEAHPRGAVELTLMGQNPYSGGTVVGRGVLRIRMAEQLGTGPVFLQGGELHLRSGFGLTAVTLPAAPTLVADSSVRIESLDFTWPGIRAGSLVPFLPPAPATLTKSGPGRLILTSNSGFGVDLVVAEGALRVQDGGSVSGNIANAGNLSFALGSARTYGGTISGSGELLQEGPGPLTLTANHTATGLLRVRSGAVTVGGAWPGPFQIGSSGRLFLTGGAVGATNTNSSVDSGATLSGFGCVTGNLLNNGTIESSGSGRTLSFSGVVVNQTTGIIRPTSGATIDFSEASAFVNLGTIDLVSGQVILPAQFINYGVVIDASSIALQGLGRVGNTVTVLLTVRAGHRYQLQRSLSLSQGTFSNVGSASTATVNGPLALTDTSAPATGGVFYRVVID